MSYISGERVLEWVLQRFGQPGLQLDEFLNFEAMDTDPRITEAFTQFRRSSVVEAVKIKLAIKHSYDSLHRLGWQHGTSDPRNVIYDGHQAFIIDFDHARPSLSPARADYPSLTQWFGISQDYPQESGLANNQQLAREMDPKIKTRTLSYIFRGPGPSLSPSPSRSKTPANGRNETLRAASRRTSLKTAP